MTPFALRAARPLVLIIGTLHAQATKSVLGFWREPEGSVIEVYPCGSDVCARLTTIRKDAPSQLDGNNPDKTQRIRPLCALQIGYGFHLKDAAHAEDGKLYDPKSGKTYSGLMTAEGDALHLRGYIGIKAFGRTEIWTRTTAASCSQNH